MPVLPLPEVSSSLAATPALAESLKVTLPEAPVAVARKTLLVSPATVPRVGLMKASPSLEVDTSCAVLPLILPPPSITAKCTTAPEMAFPW